LAEDREEDLGSESERKKRDGKLVQKLGIICSKRKNRGRQVMTKRGREEKRRSQITLAKWIGQKE
jgi:hypothetical protein